MTHEFLNLFKGVICHNANKVGSKSTVKAVTLLSQASFKSHIIKSEKLKKNIYSNSKNQAPSYNVLPDIEKDACGVKVLIRQFMSST